MLPQLRRAASPQATAAAHRGLLPDFSKAMLTFGIYAAARPRKSAAGPAHQEFEEFVPDENHEGRSGCVFLVATPQIITYPRSDDRLQKRSEVDSHANCWDDAHSEL
jgi:hypothetical protein